MPHAVFAALRQGRGGGAAAAHRRDPFTRLDLVFMDTTSLFFEGAGGETLGQHGYSKDRRPDLLQTILAVLLDGDGRPVCSEMWPGNTADVTTVIPNRPVAAALRHRARVRGPRPRHDRC
jgi:transposase